jgi:hypothetical protein
LGRRRPSVNPRGRSCNSVMRFMNPPKGGTVNAVPPWAGLYAIPFAISSLRIGCYRRDLASQRVGDIAGSGDGLPAPGTYGFGRGLPGYADLTLVYLETINSDKVDMGQDAIFDLRCGQQSVSLIVTRVKSPHRHSTQCFNPAGVVDINGRYAEPRPARDGSQSER